MGTSSVPPSRTDRSGRSSRHQRIEAAVPCSLDKRQKVLAEQRRELQQRHAADVEQYRRLWPKAFAVTFDAWQSLAPVAEEPPVAEHPSDVLVA